MIGVSCLGKSSMLRVTKTSMAWDFAHDNCTAASRSRVSLSSAESTIDGVTPSSTTNLRSSRTRLSALASPDMRPQT